MSGFRKSGVWPLNPSEVTDRQIAPSTALRFQLPSKTDQSLTLTIQKVDENEEVPGSPLFSREDDILFKKRYEEGYDLDDPEYNAWLKIYHPGADSSSDKLSSLVSSSVSCPLSESVSLVPSTESNTSSVLNEILVLPQPKAKGKSRKKKEGLNSKTICITEDDVLEKLKTQMKEKEEKEQLKIEKREEKERKKIEKQEEKERKKVEQDKLREQRQQGKRESKKTSGVEKKGLMKRRKQKEIEEIVKQKGRNAEEMASDESQSDSSDAVCPCCGTCYSESKENNILWIQCDKCGEWYDFKCSGLIDQDNIPILFNCKYCT